MLYAYGDLLFEIAPFNTEKTRRSTAADFAAKDLIGRRKSREYVGEGDEKLVFNCKLFPQKLGGLDRLDWLDAVRLSGVPQMLVRGDGTPLGWFLLEQVEENSSYLNGQGIGNMIDVTINLIRDDPPSAEAFISSFF